MSATVYGSFQCC